MSIEFSKIKLIIWDLDETLWRGVLSDGPVIMPEENIQLIKDLVDCGVMCSICSKNDEESVKKELLKYDLLDNFVFNSINWTPKGQRVKQIVQEMNLREPNVLFVDDSALNREEVRSLCPDMMIEDENVVKDLCKHYAEADKKDIMHSRLSQYKVLEEKNKFRAVFGSNEDFLKQSHICVSIKRDCENHLERIADLVMRSNQLNFTKVRSNEEELKSIFSDPSIDTGYVSVVDDFGDYGIIGFFAVKENTLLHFVFSCRTLNMGIEQYVYRQLGCPKLTIIGDVSSSVEEPDPYWINNVEEKKTEKKNGGSLDLKKKMVFKGPCDIDQIFSYIKTDANVVQEFTYVNKKGVSIEGRNHTTHIIESYTLDEKTKKRVIESLPFGDKDMYETEMFNDDVAYVVLSLFTDPNLGLYREKESGAIVAFMEYTSDLTDESRWDKYINKEEFVANCDFNIENLTYIKNNYEFMGRLSPEEILSNLKEIRNKLRPDVLLMLCLGSETPYEKNKQVAYNERHLYNQKLNALIREWCKDKDNICLLDFNQYITGQESFTNNINHFTRPVYYKMAQNIIEILDSRGNEVSEKNATLVNIGKDVDRLLRPFRNRWNKLKRLLNK